MLDPTSSVRNTAAAYGYFPIIEVAQKFLSPELEIIFQLWKRNRGARLIPKRSDLSLRDLKSIAGDIAIVDVENAQDGAHRFCVRLLGDKLINLIGNCYGTYLDDTESRVGSLDEGHRHILTSVYELAISQRFPLRYYGAFPNRRLSFMQTETLIAPLSDDGVQANKILTIGRRSMAA